MPVPDRVRVPVPVLVTEPDAPARLPEKVESVAPPMVAFTDAMLTNPAPVRAETVKSKALASKVAPELTVSAAPPVSAELASRRRVPAETIRDPLNAVLLPERRVVPVPDWTTLPVPTRSFARV